MKKHFISTLLPLLLLSSPIVFNSCDAFEGQKRELKPYDPEKAGATIVEIFDITGKINSNIFSKNFDVAGYNDTIYINSDKAIYVFDKNTFEKKGEINYDLRTLGITSEPRSGYSGYGFAITNDGYAFLLFSAEGWRILYSLDLTTEKITRINTSAIVELTFGTEGDYIDGYTDRIGYNIADDTIWFRHLINNEQYFLFYRYDADEESFIFLEQKASPYKLIKHEISSIYGSDCWYNGKNPNRFGVLMEDEKIGFLKYRFENPGEELHFIDVEYLNTLTVPWSSHYDGEHIWLLVERDKQIQMLKLLPHG